MGRTCKHCGKDVPQTEGKKARRYCDDACRMAYKAVTTILESRAMGRSKTEQPKANKTINEQAKPDKSEQISPNPNISEQVAAVSEVEHGPAAGPLAVYSESRWAYLQGRGYVWDAERGLAVKGDMIGVTVPGDPAYGGPAGKGRCERCGCERCGCETDSPLVVCCLACSMAGKPAPIPEPIEVDESKLPRLPIDRTIAANNQVTWRDILAMPRGQIDEVYRAWSAIGDDLLLRLKRAAACYCRRCA